MGWWGTMGKHSQHFEISSKNTLLNHTPQPCMSAGGMMPLPGLLHPLAGCWISVPCGKGERFFTLLFLSLITYCSSVFHPHIPEDEPFASFLLKGVHPWAPPSYKRHTCTPSSLAAPGRSSIDVGIMWWGGKGQSGIANGNEIWFRRF